MAVAVVRRRRGRRETALPPPLPAATWQPPWSRTTAWTWRHPTLHAAHGRETDPVLLRCDFVCNIAYDVEGPLLLHKLKAGSFSGPDRGQVICQTCSCRSAALKRRRSSSDDEEAAAEAEPAISPAGSGFKAADKAAAGMNNPSPSTDRADVIHTELEVGPRRNPRR